MDLFPCSRPQGRLEQAPRTSLRADTMHEKWEGFWSLADERYYTRCTHSDGSQKWYCIGDTRRTGILALGRTSYVSVRRAWYVNVRDERRKLTNDVPRPLTNHVPRTLTRMRVSRVGGRSILVGRVGGPR